VHVAGTGSPNLSATPFACFWMGGQEGADHVNATGRELDLVHDIGHLSRLVEDHRRAAHACNCPNTR
jgi:hypothetical protein